MQQEPITVTLHPGDAKLAEAVTKAEVGLIAEAEHVALVHRGGWTNQSWRLSAALDRLARASETLAHARHAHLTFAGQDRRR